MSADDTRLDDAVIAYLEAVEAGRAPDRADYPELAEFFADEDAVGQWAAPLRQAAAAMATVAGDPGATTDLAAPVGEVPRLTSFGDYEVIAELGHGGMGVVYKARHKKLNRMVALKMIRAGDHACAAQKARFLAEARAVARFQHANIVQIHEIGEHEGMPYFSLELVEGGSLAGRLKGTPLADKEAAQLVEVLARAVQHAHERGIVHRDLKPANVLLSFRHDPQGSAADPLPFGSRLNECVPKVADFGLARFLGADGGQTADGAVLGTPSYMAPEQASGRGDEVGPLTDVYALGAILYECLTGRPPFRGATQMETLLLVQQEPPNRPRLHNPDVSRSLQAICLRCLAKDPHERYPSAEALADDLARFLNGEPVWADGAATSRWIEWMLRESRYTEVMTRWSGIWMATAVAYFLVGVTKCVMLQNHNIPNGYYFIVWAVYFVVQIGLGWFYRLRHEPPLSHVERQVCQIMGFFWPAFFLTACVFQFGEDGHGDPLPIKYLLPILVLEAGVVFGSVATILGGSFYLMALACFATALLEAFWPEGGTLISAAVCSPALFWLGWKYRRRAPAA